MRISDWERRFEECLNLGSTCSFPSYLGVYAALTGLDQVNLGSFEISGK